jgi:hypothetical protein
MARETAPQTLDHQLNGEVVSLGGRQNSGQGADVLQRGTPPAFG